MTRLAAALLGFAMTANAAFSDEGMWLYSSPPLKHLKDKYNFEPDAKWLEHLQKSSVRFNSGGSGSFVGVDGLVMTNHHVGAHDLEKVSTAEKNYLRDGFYAKNRADEIKCKALELNVLQTIKDVTAEVNAAVPAGASAGDAFKARQAKIAEIEAAGTDKPNKIRADVVTLYAGGVYHLYTYKRYDDIRIVFAPEKSVAFFGGDPDNFEFPRYDLDCCFFRVYENDKPIKCEHYLKWSPNGAIDGELSLVSGHPGRTNRQQTIAELEYLRDHQYPYVLSRLNRLEVLINSWAERSESNKQHGEETLFSIQNSRKARMGGLAGLQDPVIMGRKKAEEERLRAFIQKELAKDPNSAWAKDAAKAFDTIAKAEKLRAEIFKDVGMLEGGAAFNSALFGIARTIVRAADEKAKPAGDRFREFGDARLPSLEQQLFSDEPIYEDFELLKLTDSLSMLASTYGMDNDLVKQVLAGKSPKDRAYELISGTKLKDVATRKKLYEGGKAALEGSTDPMIALVKMIDPQSRVLRKRAENEIEEPKRQAYAALAKARFAMDGTNTYPDATFTLRLSFGPIKGYKEAGKDVPAFTTFDGLYARSKEQGNKYPFELPKRWVDKKPALDLKTPYNFVSTADIIGGNSGSPVVNTKGEVIGLIFDGNIQSLVLDFIYDDVESRAVSVDSRAMIEALRKVYEAHELASELTGK